MAILTQYYVFLYNINNYHAKAFKVFVLENAYHKIVLRDDCFVLMESCHKCMNKGYHSLMIDYEGHVINEHEYDNPKCLPYASLHPNNRIDYFNGKYIVADIIDYKITIFNDKLDTLAVIRRDVDCFMDNYSKVFKLEQELQNPRRHIPNYITLMSRIEMAYFYDDTTIIVCYFNNIDISNSFWYDIWKYNIDEKNWILLWKDMMCPENKPTDVVNLTNMAGNLRNEYDIFDSKILSMKNIPVKMEGLNNPQMTHKELKDIIDKYYENNNIKHSLFIYKLK